MKFEPMNPSPPVTSHVFKRGDPYERLSSFERVPRAVPRSAMSIVSACLGATIQSERARASTLDSASVPFRGPALARWNGEGVPDDITTFAPLVRRMRERIRSMEQSSFWKLRNRFFALKKRMRLSVEGAWPPFSVPPAFEDAVDGADGYGQWLRLNAPRAADLDRMRDIVELLPRKPTITLLCAGDAPDGLLRAGLESMLAQVYGYWQFCVSPPPKRRHVFEADAADPRVVLVRDAGNCTAAQAFAAGFAAATGDYVGFLHAGDVLSPEALFDIAVLFNQHVDADIAYSDEDVVDDAGVRSTPYFKPGWSPELLLSRMYIGDLCVYRRSLLRDIAPLVADAGGTLTYDLALRATERTERIYHIPRVLYHRRSGRPEANQTASDVRVLSEALARRGEAGRIEASLNCARTYIARYAIARPERISIIVPTRDHGADVDRCLASIFLHDTASDLEVLLVDNGSTERESLAAFARWPQRDSRVRVVRDDAPFNFSALNNRAVRLTSGTYLVFLNNDTEVLTDEWLPALVEQAQRRSIAGVGARLLFPDGTVQHAGVILGIGGVAGHSHRFAERGSSGYFCAVESVSNYSALTAACLMVRRNVFDEVGGFDEALTVAFNDVDLCLKFRARGYRNVYLPHVVLSHAESKSRGHDAGFTKSSRSAREQLLMKERWRTWLENDPYYNPNLTRRSEDYAIRLDFA